MADYLSSPPQVIKTPEREKVYSVESLKKFEQWLTDGGKRPNTVAAYLSRVKCFLKWIELEPQEWTTETIQEYIDSIAHLKNATRAQAIESIRSYCRFLDIDITMPDKLFKVEYLRREMPTQTEMRKIWRVINKLPDFFKQREKAIISVLYYTGARIDEARTIQMDGIDFNNRTLQVMGKGMKPREIPMNTPLMLALIEYMDVRKTTPTKSNSLFVTYGRNRRFEEIVYGPFRQIVKSVLRDAGAGHLCPYSFRHAFATNLSRQGLAPELIADLLGHSRNKNGTLSYYIVPSNLSTEDALENLGMEESA